MPGNSDIRKICNLRSAWGRWVFIEIIYSWLLAKIIIKKRNLLSVVWSFDILINKRRNTICLFVSFEKRFCNFKPVLDIKIRFIYFTNQWFIKFYFWLSYSVISFLFFLKFNQAWSELTDLAVKTFSLSNKFSKIRIKQRNVILSNIYEFVGYRYFSVIGDDIV